MRLGSLCSGIGGLELGVERALGARTVWQAEIDPHASKVLAEHWPGVPNIGDVRDLAAMTPVDILTAGYPCQPFSTAGRRKGTDDPRHLWPAVHAAIAHLGPRLVVLENVRGHLSLGFDRVLGDLAGIGYDAEWRVVRASDVGCCHQRARLFVAAYSSGREGWRVQQPGLPADVGAGVAAYPQHGRSHSPTDDPRGWQPDAARRRRWGQGVREGEARTCGPLAAYPAGAERRATQPDALPATTHRPAEPRERSSPNVFGPYAAAVRRQEAWHGPAPDPTTDGRLNPAFVEWMMGYPAGWVTDVLDSRNAALRCLGNAVVPQVAEAFCLGLMDGQAAA